jgi:ABC-type dipeptide/oligopeptide/nickel transport system permease subunit
VSATESSAPERKPASPMRDAWRLFFRNKPALAAFFMIMLLAAFALTGKFLTGSKPNLEQRYRMERAAVLGDNLSIEVNDWSLADPNEPDLKDTFLRPLEEARGERTKTFWLGTDHLGRDVAARLWAGSSVSLLIGFLVVGISVTIGIAFGGIAGYFGRQRVRLPFMVMMLGLLAGGILWAADYEKSATILLVIALGSFVLQLVVAALGKRFKAVAFFVVIAAACVAMFGYNRNIESSSQEGRALAAAREAHTFSRETLLLTRDFGAQVKEYETVIGIEPALGPKPSEDELKKREEYEAKSAPDWRVRSQLEVEIQFARLDLRTQRFDANKHFSDHEIAHRNSGEQIARAEVIKAHSDELGEISSVAEEQRKAVEAKIAAEAPALRERAQSKRNEHSESLKPVAKATEAKRKAEASRDIEAISKADAELRKLEAEAQSIDREAFRLERAIARMDDERKIHDTAARGNKADAVKAEAADLIERNSSLQAERAVALKVLEEPLVAWLEALETAEESLASVLETGATTRVELRERQFELERALRTLAIARAKWDLAKLNADAAIAKARLAEFEKVSGSKPAAEKEARTKKMKTAIEDADKAVKAKEESIKSDKGPAAVLKALDSLIEADKKARAVADGKERKTAIAASEANLPPLKLQTSSELLDRRAKMRKSHVERFEAEAKNRLEGILKSELPNGERRYSLFRITRHFLAAVAAITLLLLAVLAVAAAAQASVVEMKTPLNHLFLPTLSVDDVVMRFTEIVMTIPVLFLILMVLAVFPDRDIYMVMALLGLTSWMGTTRFVRAEILSLREQDFVQAARALGVSDFRIIWRHLVPNAISPVLVSATIGVAGAILAESTLSFLGLSGKPDQPTWGQILNEGRLYIADAPWLTWIPGVAILITVLSFNLLGEGLREAFNPKLRGR